MLFMRYLTSYENSKLRVIFKILNIAAGLATEYLNDNVCSILPFKNTFRKRQKQFCATRTILHLNHWIIVCWWCTSKTLQRRFSTQNSNISMLISKRADTHIQKLTQQFDQNKRKHVHFSVVKEMCRWKVKETFIYKYKHKEQLCAKEIVHLAV